MKSLWLQNAGNQRTEFFPIPHAAMAGTGLFLRPLITSLRPTTSNFPPPRRNPIPSRLRFQKPPRFASSDEQTPTSHTQPKFKPPIRNPIGASLLSSIPRFLDRIRGDQIGLEIASVALPVVLALAADPIASLVDTAFVGHLGSVELAAVGVSVSVFNLVSKLFNIPLLNVTTSFVAEQQALDSSMQNDANSVETRDKVLGLKLKGRGDSDGRKFLPAVSTSLALAAGIGLAEAIGLFLGSGLLINTMGIPVDSPMHIPAEQFLTLRAYGAPPMVIALAAQGTFRGFMDTKTPLYAVGAGNLLNALLDPILIFIFGLGVGGAAIATVISETIASLFTMTLATSLAAREGPIPMAGHQICLQVWLAVSLLNDALALAGQALLAREFSQRNYEQARVIIYRVLQIGATTGIALAIILFFGFGHFSYLFTTDSAVLDVARSGVLFVAVSQPVNALAFVIDGLYYGVSDFAYAAYSMVLVGLVSSIFLLVAAHMFGLAGVWTGLFLFMSLRTAAGFWRLGTKTGPWKMVWSEMETQIMEK
ncbi:protein DETOXIFICATION 44, chloroplastic isoform X2 [Phoenix dactylifera]|uniref:Protein DETOXIFICATION n=1 Tax=Phoenix dactylifera TaxID=42345 RepID=A0A8B9A2M1_PHODC|nr:protein DETOXIFICATION 44, chloroplastic isoform X2 [Phoenix dactylifera]